MKKVSNLRFRKIKKSDELAFARWWRDRQLIYFTSGNYQPLSDTQVHRYFETMRHSHRADHFMIDHGRHALGHVSILNSHRIPEVQIMIGDSSNWGRGYGTQIGTWLISVTKRKKINAAKMHVWVNNHRSIALGKKFGFKPVRLVKRRVGKRIRNYLLMVWHRSDKP
jgi:RimJ/RimL family protein N-acetyltransferase